MIKYAKEIYPLKNKSADAEQHYGYIIIIDGKPTVRQWHKPRVMGYVFMTKGEANQEADDLITSFEASDNLPPIELPEDKIIKLENHVLKLEDRIIELEKQLK